MCVCALLGGLDRGSAGLVRWPSLLLSCRARCSSARAILSLCPSCTACLQVMYRLDGVDSEVRSFFAPVAKMLLAERDPQEALEVRQQ